MKKAFLFLILFSSTAGMADSSYRDFGIDFSFYEKRAFVNSKLLRTSPLVSAQYYSENMSLKKPVAWVSLEALQERFEKIRDERFLDDPRDQDHPRRISWLYPIDGCWVRAALFNRNAFRLFIPIPDKVFAFGNLSVETENAVRGRVSWWYHVAPIVSVGDEKYVLDPSIQPEAPLTLYQWLSRMGVPEKIKIVVCQSGTYSPTDSCEKFTDGVELKAQNAQKYYLRLEQKELQRLGRDPVVELGENPPW